MTKAEERALEAYHHYTAENITEVMNARHFFAKGYEQAEKDTIAEVEKWLKANFHHRNCWNADEFCVSLRTYFGIEK